jgi:hypothetical protein
MEQRYRTWSPLGAPLPATLLGLAPLVLVLVMSSALLWGAGYELPVVATVSDTRAAVAWTSLVTLVLLAAYPVSGVVVRLMRGLWPESRLTERAISRKRARLGWLREAQLQYNPMHGATASRALAIDLRFPHVEELSPTALGNVEEAVASRVHRRYGLDLAVVWPRLVGLLSEADRRPLRAAQRRADVAMASASGWLLATVWLVVALVGVVGSRPLWMWVALTIGGIAVGVALLRSTYRRGVESAIRYGQLVEAAVDLHRLVLLDALGLRLPESDEEEWAMFEAISASLASGSSTDRFRRRGRVGSSGDEAFALFDRAVADLPGQVTESVVGEVRRSLTDTLEPTIERTLRRSLVGPRLQNFDGHLSVALRAHGRPVPTDDEGRIVVTPGERYELSVEIGAGPGAGDDSVPVRIRGGEDAQVVRFDVSVDSDVRALRCPERAVGVARTGSDVVAIPLAIPPEVDPIAPWLWIRVAQQGRTIQNLELTLAVRKGAA